jgi:hypothetical protein
VRLLIPQVRAYADASKLKLEKQQSAVVLPIQITLKPVRGYSDVEFYAVIANANRHVLEPLIVYARIDVIQ